MPEVTQSAQSKSGEVISLACNLPHGLTITHKGKTVTLNGANHPKAIDTDARANGRWGVTHDVDAAWFKDWDKEAKHPAVQNGNIMPTNQNQASDLVLEMGDAVETGVNPLDPAKPGAGVEPVKEED